MRTDYRLIVSLAVALLVLLPFAHAQQPRDARAPSPATARIAGVVIDGKEGRPLRRARVTLSGAEIEWARTVIAGDDGSFAFEGLPPGGYTLMGAKDGYVPTAFGASVPGRPGRRVYTNTPDAGRVVVRLPRGSVITGTVLGPDGEPAPNVGVSVLVSRFDPNRGERGYASVRIPFATTDDRGEYRVFGLPAGTYLVAALPRAAGRSGQSDLQVLTQAEIREALMEVSATRAAPRPGIPAPPRRTAEVAAPRPSLDLAPVFFPGTTMQERALPIVLEAGEVRTGVNLDLEYVALATISGSVVVPPGVQTTVQIRSPTGASQSINMAARPDESGRFTFRRIPPGSYTISAGAFSAAPRTGANPAEALFWGETQVTVSGEDFEGVSLTLHESITISGDVRFESASHAPALGMFRIGLNAFRAGGAGGLPSLLIQGERFTLTGIVPGVYRFSLPPRGIRSSVGGWWMRSVLIDGREALDAELEIRESTQDAVVLFSDRASTVSGAVTRADDTPAADAFVVIFSNDPRHWFLQSRRVAGVRLSGDGRYVIHNLPAGNYLVAVAEDLLPNEWFDPEVLERLRAISVPLSLAQNEVRTFDLRQR
jgi:uncharacterized protein (DUF2141 family)